MAALHLRVLVRSGLGQRGGGYGGSLSLRQRQHHHDCQHDLQKPPTLHCCDFAVMTSSCLFFSLPRTTIRTSSFSLELQRREAAEENSKLLGFASRVTGEAAFSATAGGDNGSPSGFPSAVCLLTDVLRVRREETGGTVDGSDAKLARGNPQWEGRLVSPAARSRC